MSTSEVPASSRIFIKGLPPTLTENEFKKHFSFEGRETTEARLFSNRRIGYVGYKTPEDAVRAVKYFNKSFMRMSRIGVEIARPPRENNLGASSRDEESYVDSKDRSAKPVPQADRTQPQGDDPKLKEFLSVMQPKLRKRAWENDSEFQNDLANDEAGIVNGEQHDDDDSDYDDLPRLAKRRKQEPPTPTSIPEQESSTDQHFHPPSSSSSVPSEHEDQPISDDTWARSRTNRLLELEDGENEAATEDEESTNPPVQLDEEQEIQRQTSIGKERAEREKDIPEQEKAREQIRNSMRLFLRNLSYETTNDELEAEFSPFGNVEEVHVAADKKTGRGKGFAYLQFTDPESAENAFIAKDGQIFQGRLLHILPAAAKRTSKLNEFELSKLPMKKQQQIQRRRDAASIQFNWNTLYMNPDAVVSSVAAQLGVSKSAILDPTSSDAAVKQAHAETHVIQETKSYFKSHGVDLEAFKHSQRGDTAILIKNIPHDATRDDLMQLLEEHGDIRRFLMPPSGVIAIVEMSNAVQASAAFGALAYKRLKSSMLFLEKAPKDLFNSVNVQSEPAGEEAGKAAISTTALKTGDADDLVVNPSIGTATLFVRNLNFDTSSQQFAEAFAPLTGFLTARVKTRTDPKKPDQILSMGFGFVEFRTSADAQAGLRTMDGFTLHGHKLQVRASNKRADAGEERRKADQAKREASQRTKVIIKNLPFEVTKKDVRALFGAYGQLRSVRVPKKMDRAARGFAFADFTTPKEAQSAMDALRDTHLLGRRLVLDFADEEPADAEEEIERMAAKVGGQTNAVAVQRLTGQGRKKFTTRREEEDVA